MATKRSVGDVRRVLDKEETSCARRQVETRSRFSYLLHTIKVACRSRKVVEEFEIGNSNDNSDIDPSMRQS